MKKIKADAVGKYPNTRIEWYSDSPLDGELIDRLDHPNPRAVHHTWEYLRERGYVFCNLLGETESLWVKPETDEERLEVEIATYDYYYQMSDDGRVWMSGKTKDIRIQELTNVVGREKYVELWNAYLKKYESCFRDDFVKDNTLI